MSRREESLNYQLEVVCKNDKSHTKELSENEN